MLSSNILAIALSVLLPETSATKDLRPMISCAAITTEYSAGMSLKSISVAKASFLQ
jgi:hypothetical protein